jgi:diaminohydroxyphosphoribosylaminopyrimidine deaminase/5-amino-6-(5-phosphoribosylamino)uracil reductase
MAHQSDIYWLSVAAEQSLIPISVKKNPRVGAVIVDKSGLAVAKSFHEGYASPHAEKVALDKARGKAKGATMFVSLCPCNHIGKNPSCCVEIINRGIKRVVYSQVDPNPIAQGGVEFLKSSGVEVNFVKTPKKFENINNRWLKSFELNRPFVTAKIAMTLDGKIDDKTNKRLRITGKDVELEVHQMRNGCDAIISGTGTVLLDNPRLTVRYPKRLKNAYQPIRYIVGDREIPQDYFIHDNSAPTMFTGKRTPRLILEDLLKLDVRTVLLETGSKLLKDFLDHDLVDEMVLYVAPTIIGQGKALVEEILQANSNREYKISSVGLVGKDLRIKVSLR